jgi:hypothetical protein
MAIKSPDSLSTWSSSSYIQAIAEQGKISQVNNIELVVPGSPLASGVEDFCLYLEQPAIVELTTYGGQTVTMGLAAGYHPIRCKEIISSSTLDPIFALF